MLHRRIYRLIDTQHLFFVHYLIDERVHKASQVSSFLSELPTPPYVDDQCDLKKDLDIEFNMLNDQSVMQIEEYLTSTIDLLDMCPESGRPGDKVLLIYRLDCQIDGPVMVQFGQ